MRDDQHEPNRRHHVVKLFYSPDYVRSGHAFETTRKSQWIIDSLRREPMAEVEVLVPHFLLPLAFHGFGLLAEVIKEAKRLLAERPQGSIVPALLIPYEPDDQAFAANRQFERFELGIQLFTRPIRGEVTLGDRPLYLDLTDL